MGALERPFYAPVIKSSMTSLQQISELTPTAATAHGANGLEAYSFDNSGDRHVATEKNGAGSLQLAQAAPSMAITSVTSRQRTSRQRAMIRLFPFKRLVNKTTSPYVSWNNEESSRLSGWLKLLSLLALVLMSAPTVASAHCEHDVEPATGWGYVAQNPNEERSVAANIFRTQSFLRDFRPHSRRLVPRLMLLLSGHGALRSVRLLALCPRRSQRCAGVRPTRKALSLFRKPIAASPSLLFGPRTASQGLIAPIVAWAISVLRKVLRNYAFLRV